MQLIKSISHYALFTVSLVVILFSVQANAQKVTISIPTNLTARKSATIVVPVNYTNNTKQGIAAFSFDVRFNTAVLQLSNPSIIAVFNCL
jgi:hypothetical protein